ncbi:MAG: glycerol-3-phosphate dehydrogenase/oxidase [Spirochaetes bacterium]|nr:glycerol-3-phosphate dehydrogenase/oxidase [Spirochaetota bacterium]
MNTRQDILDQLSSKTYDVVVIGGGIVGAGIAREAAMQGLSTLLLEKRDFGWGTSSRSSKLVHGGLRYLEQMHFHLVFEALAERTDLLRMAPVDALPFLFPTYKGDRVPFWLLEMGMFCYDALALFRAPKMHRFHTKKSALKLAPKMRADGLIAASEYYDAKTDDCRLVMETLRSARRYGADALNYAEVTELGIRQKSIDRIAVRDNESGKTYTASGRIVINAAGPWMEKVIKLFKSDHPRVIRASKGAHLFVRRREGDSDRAVVLSDSKTKRILFYVPWKPGINLVGTTDTDYTGDFDNVDADKNDVAYIRENFDHYFPNALSPDDIISSNAGLRPLIFESGKDERTTSREHRVIVHEPYNFISIGGGKLTTYRVMARQAVDTALRTLAKRGTPLSRVPMDRNAPIISKNPFDGAAGLDASSRFAMEYFGYADLALRIHALAAGDKSLTASIGDPRISRAMIKYFVDEEMAMSLEDVMDRRLRFSLTETDGGMKAATAVAGEMGKLLGWNSARKAKEITRYKMIVTRNRAALR